MLDNGRVLKADYVAPFAGAWIEIRLCPYFEEWQLVAPFAGAWIEIVSDGLSGFAGWSLPSRERGLKCACALALVTAHGSLPSRERGLKFISLAAIAVMVLVAPFAGAWIEIA